MVMAQVILTRSPLRWSVDPPVERIPVEEDPNSAPQVIFSPDSKSVPPVFSIPDSEHFAPQVFVPDPNEKYLNPTVQSYGAHPSIPNHAANPPLATEQASNKRKWTWIVAAAVAVVIIAVAAVVGGVVGSRNAHKASSSSDTAATATSSSSANNMTVSSSTSTTLTSTSTTSTGTTATPTQTDFGATVHMYANDTCGGTDDSFSVLNSSSQKCVVVPSNKRSIRISQNDGCNVTTWSGSNCAGSSYDVPDTDCHAVLTKVILYDLHDDLRTFRART
ncbi:hypothetical protein BDV24DRAFT_154085 [Aspergillus arachidicola]|uniref:Uncharacterized protein n=1 Tax=Aspergillus arachidicola TaxID=656916 RepID=A0A5N6XXD7_9EURO|nr:hypothetical protein BDV24DRAFT_154085 [Aspergillus arachidicola]